MRRGFIERRGASPATRRRHLFAYTKWWPRRPGPLKNSENLSTETLTNKYMYSKVMLSKQTRVNYTTV